MLYREVTARWPLWVVQASPSAEVMSDLKCSYEKELVIPRSESAFDRHKKEHVQRP